MTTAHSPLEAAIAQTLAARQTPVTYSEPVDEIIADVPWSDKNDV